jgi:hypothetical protein
MSRIAMKSCGTACRYGKDDLDSSSVPIDYFLLILTEKDLAATVD